MRHAQSHDSTSAVTTMSVVKQYEPDLCRCAKALLVLLDRPATTKDTAQIDLRRGNLAEPHASLMQEAIAYQHKHGEDYINPRHDGARIEEKGQA